MELPNLSSNQLGPMQRRPSISSLSSTSENASSAYGSTTPQLSHQRINQARSQPLQAQIHGQAQSGQSGHHVGQSGGGSQQGAGLQPSWLNNNINSHTLSSMNNVAPWVEQQAQHAKESASDDAVANSAAAASASGQTSAGGPSSATQAVSSPSSNVIDTSNRDDDSDSDDELIPTAIVIKNIPFAIKKEQLLDVMTKLNLPLPYAFNYHFDNGVFRGLAFANFTLTNETSQVVNLLNGREIGGRKLRVEYKKMLPLQERERIEREKREKRGQLEEQHRSTSNASLASLMSTASTTAATKNLSVNGTGTLQQQTERLFLMYPSPNTPSPPPAEINFNDPEILELYTQLVIYRDDISKSVFELAFLNGLTINQRKILSILSQYLNLLEFYDNGTIVIRRKPGQIPITRANLAIPPQHTLHLQQPSSGGQSQQHQQQGQQQGQVIPPSHSSSMMNLNQFNLGIPPIATATSNSSGASSSVAPELLRSHSQSAIPLSIPPPNRPVQSSTPIQQQFPQYGQGNNGSRYQGAANGQYGWQHHSPQPQHSNMHVHQPPLVPQNAGQQGGQQGSNSSVPAPQASTPTSAAALLRSSNNRSFVDVRSTPPFSAESPTPQHHHYFNPSGSGAGIQLSQPGTPLPGNGDINSRFAPFGQHTQLTGSFSSLHHHAQQQQQQQGSQPQGLQSQQDEYDGVHQKLSGLKLNQNYDSNGATGNNSSSSSTAGGNGPANGIWGK